MILKKPAKFDEAITAMKRRDLLPTSLDSAALSKLDAGIRRYSTFSSKVTNGRFLQEVADTVTRIIEPTHEAGSYMDKPRAREVLREFLQSIGYTPEEGTAGTLQDLSSDARIDLIVRTNVEMLQGHGQHVQANDPMVLDAFPCQELYRSKTVETPRQSNAGGQFNPGDGYGGYFWPNKWRGAGGKFYGGGRMIAKKDDPIWSEISRFGNPYPPFDYNSGMWVKPVPRGEAIALGVIAAGDKVKASDAAFAAPLQTGIKAISASVLAALQTAIPGATVKDGILTQEE